MENTDIIDPQLINNNLETSFTGRNLIVFKTIDSTNNFAFTLARQYIASGKKDEEDKLNGTVIVSDRQTSGRKGSVTRAGTITIPLLTSTERKSLETVFYEMGLIEPFFIDLWDNSHTDFEPVYGTFTSEISVTHLEEGDTISFSFEEAN